MSKLADVVGAWGAGRGSENRPRARRRRRRNPPTIADALEAVTYRGGSGKKGKAFIHEYETKVEAIPILGGKVKLPDGTILEIDERSVLHRSKEGLPLWMED